MTNDRLFFPFDDGDDLFDLYEERLFEDKQFFTTKALLPSVFRKRLLKMEQRESAFCRMTEQAPVSVENAAETWIPPLDFCTLFQEFQQKKSSLFQAIFQANRVPELAVKVQQLISLFEVYSLAWQMETDLENVLLAQEPDPVELHRAVQHFQQAGGKKIADAQSLTFEGKELLLSEAKRLSLWRKKEMNHEHLR